MVHGVRELQAKHGQGLRLWSWSRITGRRRYTAAWQPLGWTACLAQGSAARLRGRRHDRQYPAQFEQKWPGHAQLPTTAIYADAVGAEEKDIAQRTWVR